MRLVTLFASILALCLIVPSARATIYVVNPEGTGDFPTIQAAIDAAVDGDVIELTDGTFTGDGNRDIDFLGKTITVRSQGGSPETCVIDCQGSYAEPHRGFYFHSGEGPEARLEGVRIINGYRDHGGGISCTNGSSPTLFNCLLNFNTGPYQNSGGGMYIGSSWPALSACTFSDNYASRDAGVSCSSSSSPTLVDCVFEGNSAPHGGGRCRHTGNPC